MKKILVFLLISAFVLISTSWAVMTGKEAHEKYIYPVVRVTTQSGGGSGTVVYSQESTDGKWETYILTNHHVIDSAIRIFEEWDSDEGKDIKKEKRSIVYVEIFKYTNISTPIGTMKVEGDIVIYNKTEDMAIIKLRLEEKVDYVAKLLPPGEIYYVMDESIAVGCSLSAPPLPSVGIITRLNKQLDSLPYHMSSAQIIYGNSGGAMFNTEGYLIGIPSRVAVTNWGRTPITHMGLFIPIERIRDWIREEEDYKFIVVEQNSDN